MPSPSYLTASRFDHFYFRFPIPKVLHPERKQSSIRLSLDTRCPREALQLSRALSYVGIQLLQRPEVYGMDYLAIRDVLFDHFKAQRERMVERLQQQLVCNTTPTQIQAAIRLVVYQCFCGSYSRYFRDFGMVVPVGKLPSYFPLGGFHTVTVIKETRMNPPKGL